MGKRVRFILGYTGAFAALSLVVFSPFILEGRSFVWQSDGLTQHVKALSFYGMYLRDILASIASGQGLQAPTFSFGIGYGQDIVDTLSYYAIGDPLNLLSVFVPVESTPVLYTALVVVRLYLAGLAFSLFASYALDEPRPAAVLSSALVFVFCGYSLYAGVRHPYFANPLIYFPLVLYGVEKVLRERKLAPFAIAIALSAVSNFYFFYMIFIFMALYILLRLFALHREKGARAGARAALADFGRLVGSGVVGVLIACAVFLPTVLFFLQDTRSGVEFAVPLHYSASYYVMLPVNLTTVSAPSHWTYLFAGVIALISLVALFSERGEMQLKVALLVMGAMILIPWFGHALNGFSYAANRWSWAFSFGIAVTLCVKWGSIVRMTRRRAIALAAIVGAYMALSAILAWGQMPHVGLIATSVIWLVCAIAIGWASSRNHVVQARRAQLAAQTVVVAVVCGGIAMNGFALYAPLGGGYSESFVKWSDVDDIYHTEVGTVAELAKNDSLAADETPDTSNGADADGDVAAGEGGTASGFSRYSGVRSLISRNAAMFEGLSSTAGYWSLANCYTKEFFFDMGVNGSDAGGICWYDLGSVN